MFINDQLKEHKFFCVIFRFGWGEFFKSVLQIWKPPVQPILNNFAPRQMATDDEVGFGRVIKKTSAQKI